MAVTATWSNGVLVVVGDAADNRIAISRDNDGGIIVTGQLVPIVIQGAPVGGATIGNTTSILAYGLEGNDIIFIDEAINSLSTSSPYSALWMASSSSPASLRWSRS